MPNADNLVSTQQAAKQLGILAEDVKKLVRQEILHPKNQTGKDYFFSKNDIAQIKSNKNPTLSEEAAQVGIQIEREVVTSVSKLQKLRKRILALSLVTFSALFLSIIIIALLFEVSTQKTSDFFGYYYRFNIADKSQASVLGTSTGPGLVLQATTEPAEAPIKTSVLADVLKPVAATSLIIVKAVDSQTYEQIVTNPALTSGIQGSAGLSGADGADGTDGTSVVDVVSSVGDLIIRDADNETSRLAAGSEDQVLTITGGVPAWGNLDSSLTINAGAGLTGGGDISLGDSLTLNIGAGNGININPSDIALSLTTVGTDGLSSSNSGLEVSSSGLTLLKGCADNEILKWTDAGGWTCAVDVAGSDILHAASYDTSEALTSITSTQTILGTISVTPATATADVYVTGQAEVLSSNAADQPFTLVVETTSDCTGSTVGNATVTYLITSGSSSNVRGVLKVSGVALNPGTSEQSYSLCASTSAGDSNVQSWGIEALVID